jgi:hypothetical protein
MLTCLYEVRIGSGCRNERTLDFDYCNDHLNTPRGRQHVMDVIGRGNLTVPSQVEAAIREASEVPDDDYQTSALERMAAALGLIQDWVEESRANLDSLGGAEHWRYKDRAGQEQQRTELGVYERALDRMSRHLSAMSKVALQEKIVTLGKAQVDMMIRMMLSVITELRLSNELTDRAKSVLLQKLEHEANLVPRVEHHARNQLAITSGPGYSTDAYPTGGVTGVSVRGQKVS